MMKQLVLIPSAIVSLTLVLAVMPGCTENGDRRVAKPRDARDLLTATDSVAEEEHAETEEREDESAVQKSSLAGNYRVVFTATSRGFGPDPVCAPGAWASGTSGVATIEQNGNGYRLAFKDLPALEGTFDGDHLHLSAKRSDGGIIVNLYRQGEGRLEGLAGIGFGTGCNVGYDIVATKIP